MKKFSLFLSALLISAMSFAQTVLFTQTFPGSPSKFTNSYTSSFTLETDGYLLTYACINNGQESNNWTAVRAGRKNNASVATITTEQIAKAVAKVVVNFTQVDADLTNALYLEMSTSSDFANATKITADIAVGSIEFPVAAPAANQYYRITIDQASGSANGFNRFDKVEFYEGEAADGDVEIVDVPEFSVSDVNFTAAFKLDITSAEGTTLKYTLDNTDPATSETAVEVAANTVSVDITKSTVVKAIAIKGELTSVVRSKTYCYVNSPETAYTVAEAIEVIDEGLGLSNELYVKGIICEVESYNSNYGSITYYIMDEEGNKFQCYSGLGLDKEKFTSVEDLAFGSQVVVCGNMKKYKETYEFNYNNYIVDLVEVEPTEIEMSDLQLDAETGIFYATNSSWGIEASILVINDVEIDIENSEIVMVEGDDYVQLPILAATNIEALENEELGTIVYSASVIVSYVGELNVFKVYMYEGAEPAEPVAINVTDATVKIDENNTLWFNATWEEMELAIEITGYSEEKTEYLEMWLTLGEDIFAMGDADVTLSEGVYTLEGQFESFATGVVYNVNISGKIASTPSAVDNVTSTVAPVKVVENGNLIIIKNGVKFNATGAVVK